jgi:hypothetical protein
VIAVTRLRKQQIRFLAPIIHVAWVNLASNVRQRQPYSGWSHAVTIRNVGLRAIPARRVLRLLDAPYACGNNKFDYQSNDNDVLRRHHGG